MWASFMLCLARLNFEWSLDWILFFLSSFFFSIFLSLRLCFCLNYIFYLRALFVRRLNQSSCTFTFMTFEFLVCIGSYVSGCFLLQNLESFVYNFIWPCLKFDFCVSDRFSVPVNLGILSFQFFPCLDWSSFVHFVVTSLGKWIHFILGLIKFR